MDGNNHGIRTTHNQSPNQLFVSGILQFRWSGLTALDFMDEVAVNYGAEENEFTAQEDDQGGVFIPQNNFALTNKHFLKFSDYV